MNQLRVGILPFANFEEKLIKLVLVNSSMNTRKKGVFGGVHPQTHLFFGNLVVHTFVDEYKKLIKLDEFLIFSDTQIAEMLELSDNARLELSRFAK